MDLPKTPSFDLSGKRAIVTGGLNIMEAAWAWPAPLHWHYTYISTGAEVFILPHNLTSNGLT